MSDQLPQELWQLAFSWLRRQDLNRGVSLVCEGFLRALLDDELNGIRSIFRPRVKPRTIEDFLLFAELPPQEFFINTISTSTTTANEDARTCRRIRFTPQILGTEQKTSEEPEDRIGRSLALCPNGVACDARVKLSSFPKWVGGTFERSVGLYWVFSQPPRSTWAVAAFKKMLRKAAEREKSQPGQGEIVVPSFPLVLIRTASIFENYTDSSTSTHHPKREDGTTAATTVSPSPSSPALHWNEDIWLPIGDDGVVYHPQQDRGRSAQEELLPFEFGDLGFAEDWSHFNFELELEIMRIVQSLRDPSRAIMREASAEKKFYSPIEARFLKLLETRPHFQIRDAVKIVLKSAFRPQLVASHSLSIESHFSNPELCAKLIVSFLKAQDDRDLTRLLIEQIQTEYEQNIRNLLTSSDPTLQQSTRPQAFYQFVGNLFKFDRVSGGSVRIPEKMINLLMYELLFKRTTKKGVNEGNVLVFCDFFTLTGPHLTGMTLQSQHWSAYLDVMNELRSKEEHGISNELKASLERCLAFYDGGKWSPLVTK